MKDNLEILYQKSTEVHKYLLDWRYKLVAGFILIVSAIGYFLFTWVTLPLHFSIFNFISVCGAGIFSAILFLIINRRLTVLIWQAGNKSYSLEKRLSPNQGTLGVYGEIIQEKIRKKIDNNESTAPNDILPFIDPRFHFGITNWLFILALMFFMSMLFQINDLKTQSIKFKKNATESPCQK